MSVCTCLCMHVEWACEYMLNSSRSSTSCSEMCKLRCVLVGYTPVQKETLMKKVEQERKQEMKLSRLQAVQRVKQYKQVCCGGACTDIQTACSCSV